MTPMEEMAFESMKRKSDQKLNVGTIGHYAYNLQMARLSLSIAAVISGQSFSVEYDERRVHCHYGDFDQPISYALPTHCH